MDINGPLYKKALWMVGDASHSARVLLETGGNAKTHLTFSALHQ